MNHSHSQIHSQNHILLTLFGSPSSTTPCLPFWDRRREWDSKLVWLELLTKFWSFALGDKLRVRASVCWMLKAISCWSICLLTLSISNLALLSSLQISPWWKRDINSHMFARQIKHSLPHYHFPITFSPCKSSTFFLAFSNSWAREFFSSNACILSCKWTWSLSFDSDKSLSTVAPNLVLCSSFIFNLWFNLSNSAFFSSSWASSLCIRSSADPCLSCA